MFPWQLQKDIYIYLRTSKWNDFSMKKKKSRWVDTFTKCQDIITSDYYLKLHISSLVSEIIFHCFPSMAYLERIINITNSTQSKVWYNCTMSTSCWTNAYILKANVVTVGCWTKCTWYLGHSNFVDQLHFEHFNVLFYYFKY